MTLLQVSGKTLMHDSWEGAAHHYILGGAGASICSKLICSL